MVEIYEVEEKKSKIYLMHYSLLFKEKWHVWLEKLHA